MEIYLDVVIVLNFLVDLLLLMGTNRLAGFSQNAKRAALAAAIGGGYAAVCLVPKFAFLGGIVGRLSCLALMAFVAFGRGKGAVRRGILFIFLSMALGGIALGLGNGGFGAIVLGALGVAILCVLGFCGRVGQEKYAQVDIRLSNRRLRLTALLDTGNTLRDPVSGTPVLVVDAASAAQLLDLSAAELSDPVGTLARRRNHRLRLIPYHAVGKNAGFLLATNADELLIDGRKESMIIAFAPQQLGQGKAYQALAGGNLL